MNRREFLSWTAAAGALAASGLAEGGALEPRAPGASLLFAPHIGMFRHLAGDEWIDQIRWAGEQGFRAFEDLHVVDRSAVEQERIGAALDRAGMTFGMISGVTEFSEPTFASGRSDHRDHVLLELERALDCARRTRSTWCAVVPGRCDRGLSDRSRRRNLLGLLRECADRCADAGVVLLVEPVDAGRNPSRMAVSTLAEAVEISRELAHPACGVACDLYAVSQQLSHPTVSCRDTGSLLAELGAGMDRIRYLQWGDFPGRKEPGTGTLDFDSIVAFLLESGYRGPIGMDHGNSRSGVEGELAVLEAYRRLNSALPSPPRAR